MRINAGHTPRPFASKTIVVLFGLLAFGAVLFVGFFAWELVEARRETNDVGIRSRESDSTPFCWSEKARRNAAFAPFNAAPTQAAATRLLFEYFLDVENAAEERNFTPETCNFYRTSLTDARNRFQSDADSFEERRRDADDAQSARGAAEIFRTWNDDVPTGVAEPLENDDEFGAATAFLSEFADDSDILPIGEITPASNAFPTPKISPTFGAGSAVSNAVPRSKPQPFAALSELEKSADFRDSAEWLNGEKLVPAPVSVESAVRGAVPKTLGAWGVLYWFCVLPGTFFGRLFGEETAAFFRLFSFKIRRRIGDNPRASDVVSFIFLVESFATTRTLSALSTVRLLR